MWLQAARGTRALSQQAVDALAERLRTNRRDLELAVEVQAALEGRFRRWRRGLRAEPTGKDIAQLVDLAGDPEWT